MVVAVAFAVAPRGQLRSATTCGADGKLREWAVAKPGAAALLLQELLAANPVVSYGGTRGFRALHNLLRDDRIRALARQHRDLLRDVAADAGVEPPLASFAAATLGGAVQASTPCAVEAATLLMLWQSEDAQRFGRLRHRGGYWVLPAGRSTIRPAHESRPLAW